MKRTAAQQEKRKRDLEKRKQLEKVILRLAAEQPDEPAPAPPPRKAEDPERG